MGMSVKCPKCSGTGNMGFTSSVRCRLCGGTGQLVLSELADTLLYEWLEGYQDEHTDDDWLEEQLQRLMRVRRSRRSNTEMSTNAGGDVDDSDLIDEDPDEDEDETLSVHPRFIQFP